MTTKTKAKRQTVKPITVDVYFVIRSQKCELATSSKIQASSFVESFNKVRPSHLPAAHVITRAIEV